MLIDLERNDLGRVCPAACVDERWWWRAMPTSPHRFQLARGTAPRRGAGEVLAAFPGRHHSPLPEGALHADHRRTPKARAVGRTPARSAISTQWRHGPQHPDPQRLAVGHRSQLRAGAGSWRLVAASELDETRAKARGCCGTGQRMSARVLREGRVRRGWPEDRGLATATGVRDLLVPRGEPVWWAEHWQRAAARGARARAAIAGRGEVGTVRRPDRGRNARC